MSRRSDRHPARSLQGEGITGLAPCFSFTRLWARLIAISRGPIAALGGVLFLILGGMLFGAQVATGQDGGTYLGTYSANPYSTDSSANPYGTYGSEYASDSVNNPYGTYGSQDSDHSVNDPQATRAPKLYDREGNFRGKLSNNPDDPDSIANPDGRYGSEFSPDSVNNPYGAGDPYAADSPTNPYATEGWSIVGEDP